MLLTEKQSYRLVSVLIFLTCLSFINRYPTGDDAWFAEQSYWLQKDGIIRSEFFRGVLGWENQLLVSHKLFLAFGAVLIKLFGFGLPTVQWVGLISLVVIVILIRVYIYQEPQPSRLRYLLLILILIFSNRLLIKMGYEDRPELMLAALGLGSFLCIRSEKNRSVKAAWAGFLAALAMLCHLNGVIYLIAGFVTYVYIRRYKEAVIFAIVGSLVGALYFVDIIQAENGFAIWSYQFRNDPATQNAFGVYSKLIVMLTFPRLFVESPEQMALSILFVFVLWHQRHFLKQLPRTLVVYSSASVTAFWLLTKNGSGTYMPLFMPFMLLIIYELYRQKPFAGFGLKLVLLVYFVIGIYGTFEIIYKNYTLGNFPAAYRNLRRYIPQHTNGLVPLTFFFNEYEQYTHLLSYENFIFQSGQSTDLAPWARQHGAEFMVMDYVYRPESFYPKPGTRQLPFYRLAYFDGRFAVYLRQ